MAWKKRGAAMLAAFLYAQGLLGFAAVSAAVMRNTTWPAADGGYGVEAPAELHASLLP